MPTIPKPIELPTTTEDKLAKAIELHKLIHDMKDGDTEERSSYIKYMRNSLEAQDRRDNYLGFALLQAYIQQFQRFRLGTDGHPLKMPLDWNETLLLGSVVFSRVMGCELEQASVANSKRVFEETFPGHSFEEWRKRPRHGFR